MAKRRRYPWTLLGIDKTDDLRAIKIAYAAKLKVTRPEENAEAFQELVAARDAALIHAGGTSRFDIKTVKSHEEDEICGGPRGSKRQAIEPIELPEFHNGDPEFEANDSSVNDGANQNIEVISNFLDPDNKHPSFNGVEEALKTVKALGIDERLSIEDDLLLLVDKYLYAVEADPFLKRGLATGSSFLWNERNRMILALDAEFGWTENDRRLTESHLLEDQALADRLQRLKNPQLPQQTGQVETIIGWRRYVGYAVLAYFGLVLLRLLFVQAQRWIN
jgi:hypothetical protein